MLQGLPRRSPLAQENSYQARNFFFKNGDIGALVNVAGAGILDSANNVDDARRFIEYLLGEEVVYFATETYEYPLVSGVSVSGDLPPLMSLQPPSVNLNNLDDLEGTLRLLQDTGVLP